MNNTNQSSYPISGAQSNQSSVHSGVQDHFQHPPGSQPHNPYHQNYNYAPDPNAHYVQHHYNQPVIYEGYSHPTSAHPGSQHQPPPSNFQDPNYRPQQGPMGASPVPHDIPISSAIQPSTSMPQTYQQPLGAPPQTVPPFQIQPTGQPVSPWRPRVQHFAPQQRAVNFQQGPHWNHQTAQGKFVSVRSCDMCLLFYKILIVILC